VLSSISSRAVAKSRHTHDAVTARTQIAIAQLCLGLFGFVFSLFGLFGFPVLLGSIIWAIVDAIVMFSGSVKDNHGRKLR
jgi:Fe2+ transport system protein B